MGSIEEDLLKHLSEKGEEKELKEAEAKSSFNFKRAGIAGGALIAILWKLKFLVLLALGKLKFFLIGFKFLGIGKIFLSGGSMLLSVAAYATVWGFPYALGFVLLILVHEMGHVLALRLRGIKASVPVFIPFVGAFVALKEMPKNVKIEAEVSLAGPVLGTVGALACYGAYYATGEPLMLSLAFAGFFINLFNLMPVLPLDGGRIVGAISPWLWLMGIVICVGFLILHPNLILIILVVMSLPRLFSIFHKAPGESDYYSITPGTRLVFSLLYFGLAGLLGFLMAESHVQINTILETIQ